MRREWQSYRGAPGDEKAEGHALALANIADGDFMESIVHAKALLDRVGGSITIAAYREKLDANGNRVGEDDIGTHETLGYLYQYDHFNKTPDAPREPNADFAEPPELDLGDDDDAGVEVEPVEESVA